MTQPSISFHRRGAPGAVLLLVLCAVAILTVLAVEVAHRARLDVQRGQRMARALAIKRAFDSGIATARGLILESRTSTAFDYFGDAWGKPLSVDLADGAVIRVQVYDESGKLNLLKLKGQTTGTGQTTVTDTSDQTITRLFSYLRKHDSNRADRWKDAEVQVRQRLGVLSAVDASGNKVPTNPTPVAPLLTLDGLREAGLPVDLVFGTPPASGEKPELALCDLVTTFGDGLINLNTAPEGVLFTMDVNYEDNLVNSIVSWRGVRSDDGTGKFKAFQDPTQLQLVQGIVVKSSDPSKPDLNLYSKVREHVTVRSACFSAKIDVVLGTQSKSCWVFFDASQAVPVDGTPAVNDIKVLTFEEIEP